MTAVHSVPSADSDMCGRIWTRKQNHSVSYKLIFNPFNLQTLSVTDPSVTLCFSSGTSVGTVSPFFQFACVHRQIAEFTLLCQCLDESVRRPQRDVVFDVKVRAANWNYWHVIKRKERKKDFGVWSGDVSYPAWQFPLFIFSVCEWETTCVSPAAFVVASLILLVCSIISMRGPRPGVCLWEVILHIWYVCCIDPGWKRGRISPALTGNTTNFLLV